MEPQKVARRSACDRCRVKKLRCPRDEHSTEPCPRCVSAGVPCTKSNPGVLGRPRKHHTSSAFRSPWAAAADSPCRGLGPLRNIAGGPECRSPRENSPSFSAILSSMWPEPETSPSPCAIAAPSAAALDKFDFTDGIDILDMNHMMGRGQSPSDLLDLDFLSPPERPRAEFQFESITLTMSLLRFHEKLSRCITFMETVSWAQQDHMPQECIDQIEQPAGNPVSMALLCTKEFSDIVQGLNSSTGGSSLSPPLWSDSSRAPATTTGARNEPLSTQAALLILSSYLQLVQFYSGLFSHTHQALGCVSPEMIDTLRVKAVIRIGGVSSLQDMAGKAYARAIIDAVRDQVQCLERQLGLPARYCMWGSSASEAATSGIFADADLAPLLQAVMAREDAKSISVDGRSSFESAREHARLVWEILAD